MGDTNLDVVSKCVAEMEERLGFASAVVLEEEAREPSHPLHNRFTWDDSEAARRWRVQQAATLIRSVKFIKYGVKNSEPMPALRKYVPTGSHCYEERTKAMAQPDVRLMFIARHVRTLQSWCNETADVPELKGIRKAILSALAKYT